MNSVADHATMKKVGVPRVFIVSITVYIRDNSQVTASARNLSSICEALLRISITSI